MCKTDEDRMTGRMCTETFSGFYYLYTTSSEFDCLFGTINELFSGNDAPYPTSKLIPFPMVSDPPDNLLLRCFYVTYFNDCCVFR
jgi:hypothetical protein